MCDRIGQLLNDYGKNNTGFDRTPAFQMHRPSSDTLGREVAAGLKSFNLRPLLQAELLAALCDALRDEDELEGFRRVFLGLMQITGQGDDE
jgi:hypothetical protein